MARGGVVKDLVYSRRDQGMGRNSDVDRFIWGNNPGSQWSPSVAGADHVMHSQTFTSTGVDAGSKVFMDYECSRCGKGFRRVHNLQTHMLTCK